MLTFIVNRLRCQHVKPLIESVKLWFPNKKKLKNT